MADKAAEKDKDKSKVHKLSLKGSAKLVAEFVRHLDLRLPPPIHILPVVANSCVPIVSILDTHDSVRTPACDEP